MDVNTVSLTRMNASSQTRSLGPGYSLIAELGCSSHCLHVSEDNAVYILSCAVLGSMLPLPCTELSGVSLNGFNLHCHNEYRLKVFSQNVSQVTAALK
jgi:hypothetical protein